MESFVRKWINYSVATLFLGYNILPSNALMFTLVNIFKYWKQDSQLQLNNGTFMLQENPL